ncbi:MAG: penicillin acylase family protein [Spirosomataceae bacterium]
MKIYLNSLFLWLVVSSAAIAQEEVYIFRTPINPLNINIVRDEWGVAHIFGKTDAETAYGLAWAHAEDDFKTIQEVYAMASARSAMLQGKKGMASDFLIQAFRIPEIVESSFNKDVPADFKAYLEGYCQGLNAYAAAHPKEVLHPKLFPITPKHTLAGYCFTNALMMGVDNAIKRIMDGNFKPYDFQTEGASNAFAFSKKINVDGKTLLVINAHQPLEGASSFYEVHLVSEQGLNIHGGLFPGAPVISHGANPNLGWAHTTNHNDGVDIFRLEINPRNPMLYSFDGHWEYLEYGKAKFKVKGMPFKIWKRFFWSKYGPVFHSSTGTYAVRTPATLDIASAEQWYRMGKSTHFGEFLAALKMRGLPHQNITYADRDDNIFFLSNSIVPNRNPLYDWRGVVPGNTSQTLWDGYMSLQKHPQVLNPASGFVYNVNHTPFNCTAPADNPNPKDYPVALGGFETKNNNRSLRFMELYQPNEKISIERLKRIKYDVQLPKNSPFLKNMDVFRDLDPEKYPDLADVINEIRTWDFRMDSTSYGATLIYLAMEPIIKKYAYGNSIAALSNDLHLTEAEGVKYLRMAREHLVTHFGQTNVRYGRFLRHRRGAKDFPFFGFPDVMAAMAGRPEKDGTYTGVRGEDFMMFVQFSPDGEAPEIETIKAYGASSKPDSPHYNDQMELYLQQKTKKMTFDRDWLFKHAKRVYPPLLESAIPATETDK